MLFQSIFAKCGQVGLAKKSNFKDYEGYKDFRNYIKHIKAVIYIRLYQSWYLYSSKTA